MMLFFGFVLGFFVGSFLNVLVDRLPRGETVFGGRSHCEKCKKTLKWHDLIPLFSFLQLKGKCRYCHTPLSFYYPVIEFTTGVLFVLVFAFLNEGFMIYDLGLMNVLALVYYLFMISTFIVIFFADLKYGIIPDTVLVPSTAISFLYIFLNPNSLIINHILSAVGASLFFFFLFLVTQGRGMGFGDVKFAFLMGLILGFPNIIVSLYTAFLTGALIGCILIIWKRKKLLGTRIPFGPFLVFGTILTIFLGERILQNSLKMVMGLL